jgi:virginiamycin B lyase
VIRRVWQGLLMSLLVALGVLAAVPLAAQATAIAEFSLIGGLSPDPDPLGLESGPDGNLWFTDGGTPHAIGRITTSGAIQRFTQGLTSPAAPFDITQGPDGNMWFTATGSPPNAIGRVTPSGAITEFGPPVTQPNMAPAEITVGPDGNLWFLDVATPAIAKITPAGVITEFTSGLLPGAMPETLTAGADGNMWFTDKAQGAIGRVTPGGTIKEFPTGKATSMPTESTLGADGNVWFSDPGVPAVGRVTPDGTITEFTQGLNANADPDPMTLGPDGNVWFIDQNATDRAVGRITPSGAMTEFAQGLSQNNAQDDITVGADGNIWVEQASQDMLEAGGVARITTAGVITQFKSGQSGVNLNPGQGGDGDALLTGADGNLWFSDRGSKAIGKISLQIPPTATTGAAGAVTDTTATVSGMVNPLGSPTTVTFQYGTTPALTSTAAAGTLPAGGDPSNVTADLTGLTPGTVIFYRVLASNGFGGTVAGAVQSFMTTGSPPSPPLPPTPPTPSPPPTPPSPAARLTTATVGNQQIQLVTPSLLSCTAKAKTLSVALRSAAIAHSHAAKLRFKGAAFFIDKGIRHTRKRTRRLRNGHKHTTTVVRFTANAVAHRLPSRPVLRLAGLKSGMHTLRVTVSYKKTVTSHHHRRAVTVTKTVTAKFKVC